MPLLYLDATGAYSDPANTNYKYLRDDGQWAAPDSDHEFYDATGAWSVPELVPPLAKVTDWDAYSWEEINDFGQRYVLKQPDAYGDLLHVTKTVPLGSPVGKSIVFEIVDVCHADWGEDNAFVWMPKEECLQAMGHQSSNSSGKSYRNSLIRNALTSGSLFAAFPSDLSAVWKDINYKYLTTTGSGGWSASGTPFVDSAKLTIPSLVEMGLVVDHKEYGKEGTILQAFASAASADRVRKINDSVVIWWLRSLDCWDGGAAGRTLFASVYSSGDMSGDYGRNSYGVCPCFAV